MVVIKNTVSITLRIKDCIQTDGSYGKTKVEILIIRETIGKKKNVIKIVIYFKHHVKVVLPLDLLIQKCSYRTLIIF